MDLVGLIMVQYIFPLVYEKESFPLHNLPS